MELNEPKLSTVTLALEQVAESCMSAVQNGSSPEEDELYKRVRSWLRNHPAIFERCPELFTTNASLQAVRSASQQHSPYWAPRRQLVEEEFEKAIGSITILLQEPLSEVDKLLVTLSSSTAREFWDKTKIRITRGDYDGAITSSRSFLEAVIKSLLEQQGTPAGPSDDLPQLWRKIGDILNLTPAAHEEQAYRTILGNMQSVVNGIANIRNTHGDAHGSIGSSVRPTRRHAELVANLASAMAQYLIEAIGDRSEV